MSVVICGMGEHSLPCLFFIYSTLFINIISTQVPYLSTGKQSVAPEPEIVHEVRQASMKLARRLQKHLRKKRAAKEKAMRSKIFEDYVPVILQEAANLGEVEVPDYNEVLSKVTKRSLADLLGETVEEVEEEEEESLLEELDEFGYQVDEEHSNITNVKNKSTVEELEDELLEDNNPEPKSSEESKQSTLTNNEGD